MSNYPGIIRKTYSAKTTAVNEAEGVVRAYVNTLDALDLQRDVVHKGAWTQLCDDMRAGVVNYPAILANHSWDVPVGRVTDASEVGDHLHIVGQFNLESTAGRDWFSHVKQGVISQWSVGFLAGEDHYDAHGVHHITKVASFPEVSAVLVGASPGTRTLAVKAAPQSHALAGVAELSDLLDEEKMELGRILITKGLENNLPELVQYGQSLIDEAEPQQSFREPDPVDSIFLRAIANAPRPTLAEQRAAEDRAEQQAIEDAKRRRESRVDVPIGGRGVDFWRAMTR